MVIFPCKTNDHPGESANEEYEQVSCVVSSTEDICYVFWQRATRSSHFTLFLFYRTEVSVNRRLALVLEEIRGLHLTSTNNNTSREYRRGGRGGAGQGGGEGDDGMRDDGDDGGGWRDEQLKVRRGEQAKEQCEEAPTRNKGRRKEKVGGHYGSRKDHPVVTNAHRIDAIPAMRYG